MMTKWELARYLIDAKKCVDSVLYISINAEELRYIDLRKKLNGIRNEFYIKCCVVIDKYIENLKQKKKDLCNTDEIINSLYYERDKNSAHKDEKYRAQQFDSLSELVDQMQNQIKHIREKCALSLPDEITLDFVPHDRELFRLLHHITASKEDEINKRKYPLRGAPLGKNDANTKTFAVFNDTEEFRNLTEDKKKDYGVIVEDGINSYEGLQNRQDAAIRINVLYGLNVWCSINQKYFKQVEKLTELGCFDEFGVIQLPPLNDPKRMAEIIKLLEEE